MRAIDQVRILVYRVHEKGLEVLLVNSESKEDPEIWKLPQGDFTIGDNDLIELEPIQSQSGDLIRIFGIEGDWHDIPSIRGLIKHDVKRVKRKLKEVLPCVDNGAYFAVKDAFKKVMPNEYEALKELKDILADRNTVIHL